MGSPATDREILVAIYNALDGLSWTDSENWLSDAPLGDWSDVGTYDNGRVNSLQLRVQGLRGEIPPELANINPSVLILSNNQLSGEIPSQLADLASLTHLDLSGNQLSGEVPSELLDLAASLEELNLGDNELNGSKLEFASDVGEYLDAVCRSSLDVPFTWGDAEAMFRARIELMEEHKPPKELQGYERAIIAVTKLMADFVKEKDPNAMIDWDEWAALVDGPEFQAVMDAAEEAEDALDPEVQAIVNAVCN